VISRNAARTSPTDGSLVEKTSANTANSTNGYRSAMSGSPVPLDWLKFTIAHDRRHRHDAHVSEPTARPGSTPIRAGRPVTG
jgi:hypothetical protein